MPRTALAQENSAPQATPDAAAPVIVPPVALSTFQVAYPADAQGETSVLMELLVSASGSVAEAKILSGPEPFATVARTTAMGWLFKPALRGNLAMAARIRIQVRFTPPVVEERPVLPEADEPPPNQSPSAQLTAEAPIEVEVQGLRLVGVKALGRGEVRQMPGAFGDPYRAIEALPGVTPIASGLPYFFVRGSPPGNVGYFFDQVPVPLLYHVAAGPGVIHPAFIESVALYSGAYPARYGRYAGGIVTGKSQQPHWETRGELSIRLVDAGAFLEVPFADGRGSATVAGRYSYTGAIISLLAPEVSLGYWDYQTRIQYDLGPDDSVSVFSFGSHDFLAADDESGQRQNILDLTFHRINANYSRELDAASALTLTTTAGLDRTGLGGNPDSGDEDPAQLSTRSLGARIVYENQWTPQLALRVGADAQLSVLKVKINLPDGPNNDEQSAFKPLEDITFPVPGFPEIVLNPLEAVNDELSRQTIDNRFPSRNEAIGGTWLEVAFDAGAGITLSPGLRLDLYYSGNQLSVAPEPRLSVRYALNPDVSITHAIGLAHQPPSFAIPLPGLGGSATEGLQRAVQSSAGMEVALPAELNASATVFQNITLNSTDIFGASNLQDSDPTVSAFSARTTNHSYGLELYLKRSLTARLGGFISYTLSRSLRSVARLKGPSSFDRRHVLNVALAFDLGSRWRLGGRALAYSGIPAEVAYAAAAVEPPRTPWYYRLDFRLEKRWLIGSDGAWWALILEVLNTTLNEEVLRSSCYAYGCQQEPLGPVTIPSLGLEASF